MLFLPWCNVSHLGHLLTKTAAWLWPLLEPGSSPLNWAGWDLTILLGSRPGREDPVPILARVLKLPPERIRTTASLERPLHCGRAVIHVPSMVNRRGISGHHLDAARRLIDRLHHISPDVAAACLAEAGAQGTGLKPYLSRSRLSPDLRAIHGEQALEASLIQRGWQVVHPEQQPMVEQLRQPARSQIVAGELGSALHLLMYFGTGLTNRTVIGLGVHRSGRDPRTLNIMEQLRLQRVNLQLLHCLGFCWPRRIDPERPGRGVMHDRRLLVPAPWLAERMDRLAEAGVGAATRAGETS